MKRMELCLITVMAGLTVPLNAATWRTDDFKVTVSESGQVIGLFDQLNSVDYAAKQQPSPLLQARIEGQFHSPDAMTWHADTKRMSLQYGTAKIVVAVETQETHVNFELVEVTPVGMIDRVQWGPIATTINQTVGEVIGVVRNGAFAVGLQVLNVKTLGGFSLNEEGRDTSRGQTAKQMNWGSTLQAHTIDRSLPRRISVWGTHFSTTTPPFLPSSHLSSNPQCSANLSTTLLRVSDLSKFPAPHPNVTFCCSTSSIISICKSVTLFVSLLISLSNSLIFLLLNILPPFSGHI